MSCDINYDNRTYHNLLTVCKISQHRIHQLLLVCLFWNRSGLTSLAQKIHTLSPFAELFLTIQLWKCLRLGHTLCSLHNIWLVHQCLWTMWIQLIHGLWVRQVKQGFRENVKNQKVFIVYSLFWCFDEVLNWITSQNVLGIHTTFLNYVLPSYLLLAKKKKSMSSTWTLSLK